LARIDYLLGVGRVGRVDVVGVVVGELSVATPVGVDGVDLVVFPAVPVRVGYPAVLPGKVASAFSERANTTTAQAINTAATISAGK